MFLKLFNTLTRRKQIFRPVDGRTAKIYTCGPTVYDRVHLGNLRTFIFEDILRRNLKYNGWDVKQVMNITDVDDKIIKKALAQKKDIYKIAAPYEKLFFADLKKLNIQRAEFYPKATKHIKEMVVLIVKLLKKGIAYRDEDGSIYFAISKFKKYGALSGLQKRKLKIGARVSADEYKKEDAQDFVLWKGADANLLSHARAALKKINADWKSPFGEGRPGWHIECSAMAKKYLGETLDIHAGGVDLIFPHHENEIAQSEAASGEKFSRFWLHGEHLLVNNEKMSKSLGNIFSLNDLEEKNFSPLAFRYLVLTTHYRSKLNFTWESLAAAQKGLENLFNEWLLVNEKILLSETPAAERAWSSVISGASLAARRGQARPPLERPKRVEEERIFSFQRTFLSAINDDLNMPQAMAIVWQVVKDKALSAPAKRNLLLDFDNVLGLGLAKIKPQKEQKIPLKIRQMAEERERLRKNQQFIPADLLRKKIEALGYRIEDTAEGPRVSRK